MRIVKLSAFFIVCACFVPLAGCGQELQDLKMRNAALNKRKADLEGELGAAKLELERVEIEHDMAMKREELKLKGIELGFEMNSDKNIKA